MAQCQDRPQVVPVQLRLEQDPDEERDRDDREHGRQVVVPVAYHRARAPPRRGRRPAGSGPPPVQYPWTEVWGQRGQRRVASCSRELERLADQHEERARAARRGGRRAARAALVRQRQPASHRRRRGRQPSRASDRHATEQGQRLERPCRCPAARPPRAPSASPMRSIASAAQSTSPTASAVLGVTPTRRPRWRRPSGRRTGPERRAPRRGARPRTRARRRREEQRGTGQQERHRAENEPHAVRVAGGVHVGPDSPSSSSRWPSTGRRRRGSRVATSARCAGACRPGRADRAGRPSRSSPGSSRSSDDSSRLAVPRMT